MVNNSYEKPAYERSKFYQDICLIGYRGDRGDQGFRGYQGNQGYEITNDKFQMTNEKKFDIYDRALEGELGNWVIGGLGSEV